MVKLQIAAGKATPAPQMILLTEEPPEAEVMIRTSLGLIYYLPPSSWWRFVAWLGVGAVVYGLYGYRHSRLRHPRTPPSPPDFNPASDLPPSEL